MVNFNNSNKLDGAIKHHGRRYLATPYSEYIREQDGYRFWIKKPIETAIYIIGSIHKSSEVMQGDANLYNEVIAELTTQTPLNDQTKIGELLVLQDGDEQVAFLKDSSFLDSADTYHYRGRYLDDRHRKFVVDDISEIDLEESFVLDSSTYFLRNADYFGFPVYTTKTIQFNLISKTKYIVVHVNSSKDMIGDYVNVSQGGTNYLAMNRNDNLSIYTYGLDDRDIDTFIAKLKRFREETGKLMGTISDFTRTFRGEINDSFLLKENVHEINGNVNYWLLTETELESRTIDESNTNYEFVEATQ